MDLEKSGKFIAELRKARGWPQKQLSVKLCVTDRAVSKWERGAGFPDISLVTRYQAGHFLKAVTEGDSAKANVYLYSNPISPTPLEEGCQALEVTGARIVSYKFEGYFFNGADFAADYRLEIQCGGKNYPVWVSFTEENGKISSMSLTRSLEMPPPAAVISALGDMFRHPQ